MKKEQHKIHILNPDISARVHPISICVIGAGGNGGFFLQELARMELAYRALFDNSFHVTCYDGDVIEDHNTIRQLFFESDIGQKKSNVMISRINLTYGFDWESIPRKWKKSYGLGCNFVISCVDNIKTRKDIIESFESCSGRVRENQKNIYYIDIGNDSDFGQVIMGNNKNTISDNCEYSRLMHFGECFDIDKMDETKEKNTPSCSAEESLASQGLYTNRLAATLAANLMWELLRNEYIDYQGYVFNFSKGKVDKIML